MRNQAAVVARKLRSIKRFIDHNLVGSVMHRDTVWDDPTAEVVKLKTIAGKRL
jgi:hypothetical protein